MWSEVAARYSTETGSRAWFAYISRYGGTVREEELHRIPDSGFANQISAGGPDVLHGGDLARHSLDDLIWAEGYAWPPLVIGGTLRARDRAWAYPEFDWIHAYHFASPVFGALHDFAVTSESEGQTTLTFCGNGRGAGATINGILTLIAGEAFLDAEWHFRTAERKEDAGGAVTFTDYVEAPGAKPHLVASEGVFFRRRSPRDPSLDRPPTYSRYGTARIRWHLLPSADRPCNGGISFYGNPPRTPQGMRFTECVVEHWGSRPRASVRFYRDAFNRYGDWLRFQANYYYTIGGKIPDLNDQGLETEVAESNAPRVRPPVRTQLDQAVYRRRSDLDELSPPKNVDTNGRYRTSLRIHDLDRDLGGRWHSKGADQDPGAK
jgi:hypothetical protein